MSSGPGIVQRRLMDALNAEPSRQFTVEELAAIVFPYKSIGPSQQGNRVKKTRDKSLNC